MSGKELLYHYTTVESLLGIIESGALWATHIHYLNDTSEAHLLWDQIRVVIDSRLENPDETKRDALSELRQFASAPTYGDIYVVSFSKDGGDRLSQWRGYGGAGGVAIGFNIAALQAKCTKIPEVGAERDKPIRMTDFSFFMSVAPVMYVNPEGDDVSLNIINKLISDPLAPVSGLTREKLFGRRVSFLASRLKHSAFDEEKEWRVLIIDHWRNLPTRFRYRQSMVVPYVLFRLGSSPGHLDWASISRIVVGPSAHQQETIEAIKNMIAKVVGREIQVVGSKIPYRDW